MKTSYWQGTGYFQKFYNQLKDLVPDVGESEDSFIELLRLASNLYYDCYNNGGLNLGGARGDELDQLVSRYAEFSDFVDQGYWDSFNTTIVAHKEMCQPDSCSECSGSLEISCSECNGNGEVSCYECSGSGVEDCENCDGDGDCEDCNGEQQIDCVTCSGNGDLECDHCLGSAYEDCYECNGSGTAAGNGYLSSTCSEYWRAPLEKVTDAIVYYVAVNKGVT